LPGRDGYDHYPATVSSLEIPAERPEDLVAHAFPVHGGELRLGDLAKMAQRPRTRGRSNERGGLDDSNTLKQTIHLNSRSLCF
jgi:hypothetical protein